MKTMTLVPYKMAHSDGLKTQPGARSLANPLQREPGLYKKPYHLTPCVTPGRGHPSPPRPGPRGRGANQGTRGDIRARGGAGAPGPHEAGGQREGARMLFPHPLLAVVLANLIY